MIPTTNCKPKKRTPYKGPTPEEIAQKEQERLEKITAIQQQNEELELSIEDFEEIPLLGVEVTFPHYGVGTIVGQEVCKIRVRFPEIEKEFVLDKAFPMRPRFENDEEIVEAFTVYRSKKAEIDELKKDLAKLADSD